MTAKHGDLVTDIGKIRAARLSAEIPAFALARKAGLPRTRLSLLEHGQLQPREGELELLKRALSELIAARAAVHRAAAEVGWPVRVGVVA